MTEPHEWLIRKNGYYYRPNKRGYTSSVFEAGRYTEDDAKNEAAVEPDTMTAIHISEVDGAPQQRTRPMTDEVKVDLEKVAQTLYFDWADQHGWPNGLFAWPELPSTSSYAADMHCKATWLSLAESVQDVTRALQADLQSVRRLTIKYHGLGMKDPAQWRVGLEEIASVVAEEGAGPDTLDAAALQEENERLRLENAELSTRCKPDMFWDEAAPEEAWSSPEEIAEQRWDYGDDHAATFGVMTIHRAASIPSQEYLWQRIPREGCSLDDFKLTEITDEQCRQILAAQVVGDFARDALKDQSHD